MRKLFLLCLLSALALGAYADKTDWLNFSTGETGVAMASIAFQNNAKLTFGESEMVYEDSYGRRAIPYAAGAYIYFSSNADSGVEDAVPDAPLSLTYCGETRQIIVCGCEIAQQIRIISVQGAILRTATDTNTISVDGLASGLVIATAVSDGHSVTNKFTIH